jgi:hypothetical protein
MTTPVSARDHANMTVAEREFTFDALLADFDKLEDHAEERDTSVSAPADVKQPQAPHVPDAVAPHSARSESTSAARETAARDAAPETTAPDAAPLRAAEEPRTAKPRRTRELPSPEVLKLAGLIVVAALSLTLVFIALSR